MFIAKNEELIILIKETREELEQALQFMVYTSIEETEEKYVLLNGEYKTEAEALAITKENKEQENITKAKQAIEDGYVIFKEAEFETNSQTVGDLTATMLMLGDEDVYYWLSKDDKMVELNKLGFIELGKLISGYKNSVWNNKYISYKEQIEQAKTIEDVEAIVIDYAIGE